MTRCIKLGFFYSSKVVPSEVEASLARRPQNCTVLSKNSVRSHVFSRTGMSSLCKASQVVPETRISLGASQTCSSVANNISQPIAYPSMIIGDDVLHNALQRTNYSPQDDEKRWVSWVSIHWSWVLVQKAWV